MLSEYIAKHHFSRIVILIDEKVLNLYPGYIDTYFGSQEKPCIIPVQGAEAIKELPVAAGIWQAMIRNQTDRNALFVNIGGGTVSDLGGYVASNYMRGIKMIHIPTTLLAMIDAAIGGKNGINFEGIKNAIGNIYNPDMVHIDKNFLTTLPRSEILNGFGELIKYALIGNEKLWSELLVIRKVNNHAISNEWIHMVVEYKKRIVEEDPYDYTIRRILNFGHTIGHALESYFLEKGMPLSHGHVVAIGCCCEAYISYLKGFISQEDVNSINSLVRKHFSTPQVIENEYEKIAQWCKFDKKNDSGKIHISLLEKIGYATPNHICGEKEIISSLSFFFSQDNK